MHESAPFSSGIPVLESVHKHVEMFLLALHIVSNASAVH